ncbi:universal stress protein [Rossellomorea vietnamensis]|uniref:Universal stress protein n=1 Tax=Rossellomorea vietnamensis TaxID=218284 RepID=A0A5D4M8Q7_9BACI|nr:universal stress protein [Rossellomorea vietnamensis]TYR97996.1 universal stress protein [Rossellomorea vietnamensis]
MKSILLASDGSPHASKAAEHVAALLKGNADYRLMVVHVIDHEASKHDAWLGMNPGARHKEREEKLKPVSRVLEQAGIAYSVNLTRGDPAEEIITCAEKENMDMIVIGSRGLNAVQELVLGSVSHKVVQKADRPVLVVK